MMKVKTKSQNSKEALVDKPGYLHLEEVPFDATCLISMAPLNSSGDIYHILAYLILANYHNKILPQIELTYDIEPAVSTNSKAPAHSKLTVGNQVDRAKDFASTLGFSQVFTTVKQTFNETGRENVRHSVLETNLKKRTKSTGKDIWYVDQMATTSLVAAECKAQGYQQTAAILRAGYSVRDESFFPKKMQKIVDNQVAEWLSLLDEGDKNNHPLVVLHIRYSSKANKEQNLPDNFLAGLVKTLGVQAGYQVCVILADDRKKSMKLKDSDCIIEPFKNNTFFKDKKDYAKQAHLQLLLKLQEEPRTKAIIGNTSGTLDLAAFIGLTTYSIHQFTSSSISYQESRLFLQMCFMTIDALLNNKGNYSLSASIEDWLKKPVTGQGPKQWEDREKIVKKILAKKESAGFEKMFSFSLFKKTAQKEIHPIAASVALLN